jgi:hypothetical protein
MQSIRYPEGALPAPVSRAPIIAALVALLVGGAIATGIWWLTDNDVDVFPTDTKVIVTQPVEPSEGTAAKNEAGTAAAVGGSEVPSERFGATQYRYDGGPEEGSAGSAIAGAGQGP